MAEVYIGSYTETIYFASGRIHHGRGEGIYHYSMDDVSGELSLRGVICGEANPSYVERSADGSMLYAVNELKQWNGHSGGAFSAYRKANGEFRHESSLPTDGIDPCHVGLSPDGKHAIVSNYGSGSFAVYRLGADGSPEPYCQFIQDAGSGPHAKRQNGPHAHFALFTDSDKAVLADLGTDELTEYVLTDNGFAVNGITRCTPGYGPRSLAVSADGKYLYVVNELACSVCSYEMNGGRIAGKVSECSLKPEGTDGDFTAADIHIHPNGEYLYATIRGANLIGTFRISSGALQCLDLAETGGDVPRSFAIHPNGKFLLLANQNSDNLILFSIGSDGRLSRIGETQCYSPVCVKIYE